MSRNKDDKPKTARQEPGYQHSANKPKKGELFVRTPKGSVLLTQTLKLFGRSKGN